MTAGEVLLKQEFLRRKKRNPAYSMRAFAKSIGLTSGRLSEIFSGKRRLTDSIAKKVLENLKPDLVEKKKWQQALANSTEPRLQLDEAHFSVISDPIHYAILCLMETEGFFKLKIVANRNMRSSGKNLLSSEIQWIGERLEKSTLEVELALENLKALQLITDSEGHYQLSLDKPLETTTDVPSSILRESHRRTLLTTAERLEKVPNDLRDVTSITMAIDTRNIPKAKTLIKNFRHQLSLLLEDGEKSEVYELSVQLMPLTQVRSEN